MKYVYHPYHPHYQAPHAPAGTGLPQPSDKSATQPEQRVQYATNLPYDTHHAGQLVAGTNGLFYSHGGVPTASTLHLRTNTYPLNARFHHPRYVTKHGKRYIGVIA